MPRAFSLRPATWIAAIAGPALSLWLLSGCNVFSPLAYDNNKDLTYRGLLYKGSQAINDKDYKAAAGYFEQAIALNQRGSEAYLFDSKALVSEYNLDYTQMNQVFECKRATRNVKVCLDNHIDTTGIPFVDSTTTLAGIDSVYYPIATSVSNLEHIIRKAKDTIFLDGGWTLSPDGDTASDGRISEGVARLDLGLLEAVKAMLGPLDLDNNNRINDSCGLNICPLVGGHTDDVCMETKTYTDKCKDGLESESIRFNNFKNLTKSVNINKLDTKDLRAREVSTNPNDINSFLDAMAKPIAGSNFNLDSVNGSLNGHGDTSLSKNLNPIVSNIKDLGNFLSYMRYNDLIDNDYDTQDTTGNPATPMRWYDFDKDGGIRWNYDEPMDAGYPTDAADIGSPLHRMLHPELYVKFTDRAWLKRSISGDVSVNSRKGIMEKHCVDEANKFPTDGTYSKYTPLVQLTLITQICSTTTTILKPSLKPPTRSDWVSGTYGVDEEMVDDRDNDHDGIKDEDARNAKGLDDDDDALLNVNMLGTTPAPMVWNDAPEHVNRCYINGKLRQCSCPDIDVSVPLSGYANKALQRTNVPADTQAHFERSFCIGSLEHRLYLSHFWGRDSLEVYYSEFTEEGSNKNCIEDYDKLDSAVKVQYGFKSHNNLEVQLACHFKHIWNKPTGVPPAVGPPPNSEWTSGVFGIDEEIPDDGVDNDGDGWIDEDVK